MECLAGFRDGRRCLEWEAVLFRCCGGGCCLEADGRINFDRVLRW